MTQEQPKQALLSLPPYPPTNIVCKTLRTPSKPASRDTRLDDVIQKVLDFTRKYRDCQFVASCRVAAYNHWFDKLKDVEIADFDEKQIEQFVRNFFRKEPKTAQECWEKLKNSQPLKEMASVPLLLTLLCITYNARQDFERNRALLYAKAIDALINRWDAERRIKRDKLYQALDEANMVNMLARIAAGYFEQNLYFFREEDLYRQMGNFLQDILGQEAKNKGKLVLHDIETHYGILVRRSEYAYSFAHLTFLEYFTAQYIVDNALRGGVNRLVDNHFGDDRWLEVFLLTAGKLGSGTEEFILLMQRKNRRLIEETPELEELLRVVQTSVLPGESRYPLVFREAMAVLYTLSTTRALGLARALAHDLAHVHVSDIGLGIDNDIDRDIDRERLKDYGRSNKLITEIMEKIDQFLKGNICIVKCLDSGAFVSAAVRERVLGELLKPGKE